MQFVSWNFSLKFISIHRAARISLGRDVTDTAAAAAAGLDQHQRVAECRLVVVDYDSEHRTPCTRHIVRHKQRRSFVRNCLSRRRRLNSATQNRQTGAARSAKNWGWAVSRIGTR